jgi:hypothetical protein
MLRTLAQESAQYEGPRRDANGHYQPVAQIMPMNDLFVGGFDNRMPPPTPPPKEYIQQYIQSQQNGRPRQISQVSGAPISTKTSASSSKLTHMSAVERSQAFRIARMEPHLQLMVGPLLRYDTIDEQGVWNGFALVVSKY